MNNETKKVRRPTDFNVIPKKEMGLMPNTQESIDQVCEYRFIPNIKKGALCEVSGEYGRIWGGNHAANFNVKFDKDGRISNCHPYWKMKIFNKDGSILYEYKDER
jgi:hypothetical protein